MVKYCTKVVTGADSIYVSVPFSFESISGYKPIFIIALTNSLSPFIIPYNSGAVIVSESSKSLNYLRIDSNIIPSTQSINFTAAVFYIRI